MKETQKIFTVKLKTTDTDIDKSIIRQFMQKAIEESPLKNDLTFSVDTTVGMNFNFLNDCKTLKTFITTVKEDFLKVYPYFAEEYDFCLSEFNKNPQEVLIDLLENTSTKELAEPYGLTPRDFKLSVKKYIKNNFTLDEQEDFLKLATEKGLKITL